jgi:hypothetical protein
MLVEHHLLHAHTVTFMVNSLLIYICFRCCRELFAVCVESFKEVENAEDTPMICGDTPLTPTSVPQSPILVRTPNCTPGLKRKFSFSGKIR